MKASRNKELDYLLVNMLSPPHRPSPHQALQYRSKHSNKQTPFTFTQISQYYHFGPGVTLYFGLLRFLIAGFFIIFIVSLPTIINNSKGNGLSIYTKKDSQSGLMRYSLANQQFFEYPLQNQQWTAKDVERLQSIQSTQLGLIFNDIGVSLIFAALIIGWGVKSNRIVKKITGQIKKKDEYGRTVYFVGRRLKGGETELDGESSQGNNQVALTLASYYTLKIHNVQRVIKEIEKQQKLKTKGKNNPSKTHQMQLQPQQQQQKSAPQLSSNNRSKQQQTKHQIYQFMQAILKQIKKSKTQNPAVSVQSQGQNSSQSPLASINLQKCQIQLVYDYKDFLFQLDKFLELIEDYGQSTKQDYKLKLYNKIQQAYYEIKKMYISNTEQNVFRTSQPFLPVKAFISFETIEQKNTFYIQYKNWRKQQFLKAVEGEGLLAARHEEQDKQKGAQSHSKQRKSNLNVQQIQMSQQIQKPNPDNDQTAKHPLPQSQSPVNSGYISRKIDELNLQQYYSPQSSDAVDHPSSTSTTKIHPCDVQPSNIIWQNYHLNDLMDLSKRLKMYCLLTLILFVALILIFLINLSMSQPITTNTLKFQQYKLTPEYKNNPNPTYHEAIAAQNNIVVYIFCSQLTHKTFQWEYFSLCEDYYTNFQFKLSNMVVLSLLVFSINFVLNRVIHVLAQRRRYRTQTEKQRFLIVTLFVVVLVNSGLLVLLIRAELNNVQNGVELGGQAGDEAEEISSISSNKSLSLLAIFRNIFGQQLFQNKQIELYESFNRKWYVHIGKQLMLNYLISLIIAPWFLLFIKLCKTKYRQILSKSCVTQKQMNSLMLLTKFDFHELYAVLIVQIWFAMCYGSGIPAFYLLAMGSLVCVYLSSKLMFKHLTRRPVVFDHLLNTKVSRILLAAGIAHQVFSINFLFVEDIFAHSGVNSNGNEIYNKNNVYPSYHKWPRVFIFIIVLVLMLILVIYYEKVVGLIIDKLDQWSKKRNEDSSGIKDNDQRNHGRGQGQGHGHDQGQKNPRDDGHDQDQDKENKYSQQPSDTSSNIKKRKKARKTNRLKKPAQTNALVVSNNGTDLYIPNSECREILTNDNNMDEGNRPKLQMGQKSSKNILVQQKDAPMLAQQLTNSNRLNSQDALHSAEQSSQIQSNNDQLQNLPYNPPLNQHKSFSTSARSISSATPINYLRSYRMQDNPQYEHISYTLMILHMTINQHQTIEEITQNQLIFDRHVGEAGSVVGGVRVMRRDSRNSQSNNEVKYQNQQQQRQQKEEELERKSEIKKVKVHEKSLLDDDDDNDNARNVHNVEYTENDDEQYKIQPQPQLQLQLQNPNEKTQKQHNIAQDDNFNMQKLYRIQSPRQQDDDEGIQGKNQPQPHIIQNDRNVLIDTIYDKASGINEKQQNSVANERSQQQPQPLTQQSKVVDDSLYQDD